MSVMSPGLAAKDWLILILIISLFGHDLELEVVL